MSHQSFTHSHSFPMASGSVTEPETINVNIITPGIWTSPEHPQLASDFHVDSTQHSLHDARVKASAPPMTLQADQQSFAVHSSSAPAALSQQWAQQGMQASAQLPRSAADNKRNVATNTQLSMQKSNSGTRSGFGASLQHPNQADDRSDAAQTGNHVPSSAEGVLNRPSSLPAGPSAPNDTQPEVPIPVGVNHMLQAHGQMPVGFRQPISGNIQGHSGMSQQQPTASYMQSMPHSDSAGSLSSLPSTDGLDRRASGQVPMRAGSPALGGRAASRPPTWSAQKHDPFGELVSQDLRSTRSRSMDSSNIQGQS